MKKFFNVLVVALIFCVMGCSVYKQQKVEYGTKECVVSDKVEKYHVVYTVESKEYKDTVSAIFMPEEIKKALRSKWCSVKRIHKNKQVWVSKWSR